MHVAAAEQDKQLVPQALALLKQESAKNFRIEVTSDSMIYQDEMQEKQDRMAFLQAMGGFFQQAVPMATAVPETTPMLMEMLKFAVTAFKAGKQLEGIIDETADKFREMAKAKEGQPPPPTPEMQKVQMEMQAEQQKMQAQAQYEMAKFQAEQQAKAAEAQVTMQVEQAKIAAQMELEKAKQEYQAQENRLQFELETAKNEKQMSFQFELDKVKYQTDVNKDILLTYLDNASKIETARISAGLDDGTIAYLDNVEQARMMQSQLGLEEMARYQGSSEPSNSQLLEMMAQMMDKVTQPKRIVRDADGNIAGVVHGESPEAPTEQPTEGF